MERTKSRDLSATCLCGSRKPRAVLNQFGFRQRQFPYPLSRCGKDRIAQCRSKWRDTGLTHSRRGRIATYDLNSHMPRRPVHTRQLKVVEITLIDRSIRGGNLPEECQTRAENRGALELVSNIVGADDRPRIDRCPDIWNMYLPFSVNLYFNNRGHIRQK